MTITEETNERINGRNAFTRAKYDLSSYVDPHKDWTIRIPPGSNLFREGFKNHAVLYGFPYAE